MICYTNVYEYWCCSFSSNGITWVFFGLVMIKVITRYVLRHISQYYTYIKHNTYKHIYCCCNSNIVAIGL